MLAQDGNGPTDFKNGNEDGWPVERKEEPVSKKDGQRKVTTQKKNSPCDGKSDQQRYQLYKTQTN
jgi:hypothetical protein